MSRGRDVRGLILEEATRQFAAKGFDGTSLQAIADEVDITKPSLLYHYSSKAELREQVLEALFSHWNSVLPTILQAATSGDRRFEALTEEVISFFCEDPDRARLLMRETMDRPARMRELMQEYLGPWMSILADYIQKGVDEGLIYEDLNPTAYIINVVHLVVGGIATSDVFGTLVSGDRSDSDSFVDDVEGVDTAQIEEMVRLARASLFVDQRPPDDDEADDEVTSQSQADEPVTEEDDDEQ